MATRNTTQPAADLKVVESGEAQETSSREPEQQEQATPEPVKTETPAVEYSLGAGRIVYHQPFIRMADGSQIDCPHSTWGHQGPEAAAKCARQMAAKAGVRLADKPSS